jgi:hypothetical protein
LEQRREYRLWPDGRARDGAAPFLDYAAPEEWERGIVAHVVGQGWPADARQLVEQWAAGQHLPEWFAAVSARRRDLVERTRGQVRDWLDREIAYWRVRPRSWPTLRHMTAVFGKSAARPSSASPACTGSVSGGWPNSTPRRTRRRDRRW